MTEQNIKVFGWIQKFVILQSQLSKEIVFFRIRDWAIAFFIQWYVFKITCQMLLFVDVFVICMQISYKKWYNIPYFVNDNDNGFKYLSWMRKCLKLMI